MKNINEIILREAQIRSAEMKEHSCEIVRLIGDAIFLSVDEYLREIVNESFHLIEEIRHNMKTNKEAIDIISYGSAFGEKFVEGKVVSRKLCDIASTGASHELVGKIIYSIIRKLSPKLCVELGTSIGISAAYIGTALKDNGKGELVTIEGDRSLCDIASRNFRLLGLENIIIKQGRFDLWLNKLIMSSDYFDFVFIDGDKDGDSVYDYFTTCIKHMIRGGVILLDDMNYNDSMKTCCKRIILDKRGFGMNLLNKYCLFVKHVD